MARTRSKLHIPATKQPAALPFDKWSDGPLGDGFSYEDFLEAQYFWAGQTVLGEAKFGARDCDVVKSTPGATDKTHYVQVNTWLDHGIGFPVLCGEDAERWNDERIYLSSGCVRTAASGRRIRLRRRFAARPGSTLLIIDRGTPKANLNLKDFSPGTTHAFLGHGMVLLISIFGLVAALAAAGFVYQCLGARRDRQRYARGGRWIDMETDASSTWWKRDREVRPFCLKRGLPPPI